MSTIPHPLPPENRVFKLVFWALAGLLLLLMPILSVSHGQSGDEWSLILYGNDIYDYFFNGSQKALDYDVLNWKQVEGLHYYGGLYDFTVTLLHKKIFSGIDELTFRHIITSLLGAGLFIYTGLLGKAIGGWRTGVLALVLIALSPRLLGESMNNPKDIPFAFANVFFLYYLYRFLQAYPAHFWRYTLLMALGFGLALGFRVGGFLLLGYFWIFVLGFYYFRKKTFSGIGPMAAFKKAGLAFGVIAVIGYIIGIMFWPWALQEPLSRPFEALTAMTQRQIFMPVLFGGEMIPNDEIPWYYIPKWIFISNPVIVLLGFLAALALLPRLLRTYGRFAIGMLLFALFFPWLYAVYKSSVVYDTWRHFFFIYPYMCLLAALVVDALLRQLQKPAYRMALLAVVGIGLVLPLLHIVRNFPNEYVYFNELEGGTSGAWALYDFDYYQNSGKQGANWIREDANARKMSKVIVRSNLNSIDKYFTRDAPGRFSNDYLRYELRDTADWDYYITYSRYQSIEDLENNVWPSKDAAHIIRVDGYPISAVLKRPSKEGILGFRALDRNDLPEAYRHFEAYRKADPNNALVNDMYEKVKATLEAGPMPAPAAPTQP
jgi:hypothetical protein